MYAPAPMQLKEHKEYNLEVQAKIDLKIGDSQVRYRRAIWLLKATAAILKGSPFLGRAKKDLADLLEPALEGKGPIKVEVHGIVSENRTWASVEMDQLVLAIPLGWKPTLDEFFSIYGSHGGRHGIEIIMTDAGIVLQNEHQLTDPEYFPRLTVLEVSGLLAPQ
jgi:hypothetical protein